MCKKQLITSAFLIFSIVLSIILLAQIDRLDNYEDKYKQDLQQKFSRDYSAALSDNQSSVNGHYFHDTQNILIYTKGRYLWKVERTWQHEKGHLIYFQYLNESERNKWERIHDSTVSIRFLEDEEKLKIFDSDAIIFISGISEKSASQDFAEAFSAMIIGWAVLDADREYFMQLYVEKWL